MIVLLPADEISVLCGGHADASTPPIRLKPGDIVGITIEKVGDPRDIVRDEP